MADNKSLQTCHCGWSKVTTFHGLRTHQGIKGCTPKMSPGPEATQIIFNTFLPKFTYTLPPFDLQAPDGYINYFDAQMTIPRHLLESFEQSQAAKAQKELMFPNLNPVEAPSLQLFPPEQQNEAVNMSQTPLMIFGGQPKPTLADVTVKKENKPLFGSAHQPFQFSENGNQTRNALDSGVGGQQFSNPTSSRHLSPANAAAASSGKENKPSQTLSPNNQQSFIKPASFTVPNGSDAAMDQNFGASFQNATMFGDKQQSQSTVGWATSTKQVQMTKPESPNAQTSAANDPCPGPSLFKDLLTSALQSSLGASPETVKANKPNSGGSQSQATFLQTQTGPSSPSALKPLSQISTPLPTPKASEEALTEHKPVSSSKPPLSTNPAPPQSGPGDVAQSGPITPKTERREPFFETPPHSQQSATEGNQTRRALDFSTGAEQAQTSMTIPTTTSQVILPPVDDAKHIDREAERLRQIQREQIKAEFRLKIQSREQKLSEIRSRAKSCKGSLDEEWLEINSVFSDVIQIVEEARHRALQPLQNRKDKLKKESQHVIDKIQRDIEKLKKAIEEVDIIEDLDVDHLSTLRLNDCRRWTVDTSFSFGTLQMTISAMMEQIREELEKCASLELERAAAFTVDVKLDSTTAHSWLIVSKDGKEVQDGGQAQQQLPQAVGRFDLFGSVLGANRFSSGRAYWEVQVGGKSGWDLGVASAKANRKGKLTLSPDRGYWAIVHFEGEKYAALTAPPVALQLKEKPQKVGVFLDYDEGLVSFYDVTNQSHIYSFTKCSFDDGIFPYFSPHLKQNGKNSEALVITAVEN